MTQKNTISVGIGWYTFLEITSICFVVSALIIGCVLIDAATSDPVMHSNEKLRIMQRECVLRGLGQYTVDENGNPSFELNEGNGRSGVIDYEEQKKERDGKTTGEDT